MSMIYPLDFKFVGNGYTCDREFSSCKHPAAIVEFFGPPINEHVFLCAHHFNKNWQRSALHWDHFSKKNIGK